MLLKAGPQNYRRNNLTVKAPTSPEQNLGVDMSIYGCKSCKAGLQASGSHVEIQIQVDLWPIALQVLFQRDVSL